MQWRDLFPSEGVESYLTYVASPEQIQATRLALARMRGVELASESERKSPEYRLEHASLGGITLFITLLDSLDAIAPHLREHAVDLLVYDESGAAAIPAPQALAQIRADIAALRDLWGPDFHFSMRRVVAILKSEVDQVHRAFELGRVHVRDVVVSPESTASLLRSLARILTQGIIREQRSGIALAGGGMDGYLYTLGVLHALDRSITGKALDDCEVFVGVSSGAIAAACLANHVPRTELVRAVYGRSDLLPRFSTSTIYDFAVGSIVERVARGSLGFSPLRPQNWLETTLRNVPTGFFKGDRLEKYFRETILAMGGSDQFRDLKSELYVGATDQDTFEHVVFGRAPWDQVPISAALRASIALPPIFNPKSINGRRFIDGQVTRTSDLEWVVERGCRLVLVIDPLRPLATTRAGTAEKLGGVYATIQTLKALISTRFETALGLVADRFPDVDLLVFQPDEECARVMAGSPMRLRLRREIIGLAYRSTLRQLHDRYNAYVRKLGRFGFVLRRREDLRAMLEERDELLEGKARR